MRDNFSRELEKTSFNTKNENDILTQKTSVSLDEEKVFLSIEYKIFKGYKKDEKTGELILKTEFGKPDSKIPTYRIFSIDKSFTNNYFGLEQLEATGPQFDTEEKVKEYFKL